MLSVVLLCGLWLMCVGYIWHKRTQESKKHPLPPCFPGKLPLIGHAHMLLGSPKQCYKFLKAIGEFCLSHGGVTHGVFGTDVYYGIADPEDALTVANSCLQKHFMYDFVKGWMGNGLILSSGAIYKHHRKAMNPAFTIPMLNGFLQIFNIQFRSMCNELRMHANKEAFDHQHILKRFALRAACLTSFGIEDKGNDTTFLDKYVSLVEEIMHRLTQRLLRLHLQSDFLYWLSGLKKKEDELCAELNKVSIKMLYKKRALMKNMVSCDETISESSLNFKSVLDVLLEGSGESGLTDNDIKDELNTTVAAAFETTAESLLFTTVLIGTHKEVQEKMYQEIIEVLGPDKDVEKEDIPKLVYTDAVIREALRVVPTVTVIARSIYEDVQLKHYTLRAGSHVFLIPSALHFHSSWGPDAKLFRPERWLNKSTLPPNPNAFIGFSLGKRSCIGKTYAMMSMKVAIVHLIRNFRVTADFSKMVLKVDPTTKSAEGHEVLLECRK